MFVCVCNAIRESEIRACARQCPGDAVAVYAALGCAPQCRSCLDDADDIIRDVSAETDRTVRRAA